MNVKLRWLENRINNIRGQRIMDHTKTPESTASTQNVPSKGMDATGKRNTYSGAFKAKVVSEFINQKRKRRLKELAEHYQLHPNQIKNWKSILLKRAGDILEDKRRIKT